MFEELSERFDAIFKKLRGRGKLTEDNISEAVRDVKRALLEADVNYKVVKRFAATVQEKALGAVVLDSISPGQQFVKVVHDELASVLGGSARQIKFHTNRVNVILLAGLQGSGKTTACAKLALYFRKQGHKPIMAACDTFRAAAIDQLETLGKALSVPVYSDRAAKPAEIAKAALAVAKREGNSLLIVDTAGRKHIDEEKMAELKEVAAAVSPDEIFFVADAMTGQDAVNVAEKFHEEVGFTGAILTKMDGDARGGAALSILDVTGVAVQFMGVGEKPDGLELFHPERMASRILGMGDIVTLVERAQETVDLEKSQKLEKKFRRNQFTLQDFLDQMRQIKKMGSLGELLAMIPGLGSQLKDTDIDSGMMGKIEAIICSMTVKEREKPVIIDGSRKKRIASGSGTTVQDVNKLLKQFDNMKVMMKKMTKIAGKRGANVAMRNMSPF
ncbi:MAG: signal recognition particle protein [Chitinispirillia bacterium]|nr:signal recognition particle protein [Chitinispirillia bacterium]MCL2267927.1 signal recognition particle protein [Chitinispirillia bacterium]